MIHLAENAMACNRKETVADAIGIRITRPE